MKTPFKYLVLAFLFTQCSSEKQDGLTGKWLMTKVIQSAQDVTLTHNPNNDRYIVLKSDSTFESGGTPGGKNTGRFTLKRIDNTLFLDSDAGPEDDSHWIVTLRNDTMHWQGYGSEWAKGFELIHVKVR